MAVLNLTLVLIGLFCVAVLYSSVGHGGASGYLAILSLTTYASMDDVWLKQHVWFLNLVVAGIAFWYYSRAGFHLRGLTIPFIIASVPLAVLGGSMRVDVEIYDTLLSITLILAALRLYSIPMVDGGGEVVIPGWRKSIPVGGGIGFLSGVVGVGGGIFLSPLIMLKRWADPKSTAATAALFIWVNSAGGLIGSVMRGGIELEFEILSLFVAVVMIGGMLGSRYGVIIAPQHLVRGLLVCVLLLAAARRVLSLLGVWN